MKVFISWSGEKSKAVATALNAWIPDVLQYVTPFMSNVAIDAGTRPLDEIESELGASKFGIICVTSDNFMAPWLNFEAGAISKKLGLEATRVAPLLVDLDATDVNTPLKQFQMKKLDKDGVYDVIRSINKKAMEDGKGLDDARLTTALDRCWPDLHARIESAKVISPSLNVKRNPDEKLDEVLESVRLLTDEVKQLRSVTRRTWQQTAPRAYDWPRVPSGLTAPRTLGAGGWPEPTEITTEAELARYRTHELHAEIIQILEGTPFTLTGFAINTDEGSAAASLVILIDPKVPSRTSRLERAKLDALLPGFDIQYITADGE